MKKIMIFGLFVIISVSVNAYTLKSQKELGKDDAKNQNIIVRCTTPDGKISSQTCQLRRYVKCKQTATGKKNCTGWYPWQDLRNPGAEYSDWRKAAESCCQSKGLR
ncbi:MAG: hypothetical protein ACOX7D_01765 [Alphaproteobacteria bacterium]|jgi:hypothetical protein|nr:hypothetical protein [Alphaproteobacteria bacterium]